jgi:hypothetical protein
MDLTRSPVRKPEPETGMQTAEASSTSVALMMPMELVRRRITVAGVGVFNLLGDPDDIELVTHVDAGPSAHVEDDLAVIDGGYQAIDGDGADG